MVAQIRGEARDSEPVCGHIRIIRKWDGVSTFRRPEDHRRLTGHSRVFHTSRHRLD